MIEINNSEQHRKKSKDSRKNPEYKKLMSEKMTTHHSQPESREKSRICAKNKWKKEGAKENYSKNRIEWHSNADNKKKHSNSIRKNVSFLVENYLKNLSIGSNFTVYDIMEKYNSTYDITTYWIKKEMTKGNIVKGNCRGNLPILYTRIK